MNATLDQVEQGQRPARVDATCGESYCKRALIRRSSLRRFYFTKRNALAMEAQEILANIAYTTSGALVDLVDSTFTGDVCAHIFRKGDCYSS